MVIFHSYVSLPEGNIIRPSIGSWRKTLAHTAASVRRWRDDSTATWGWWRHIFPGSGCFLRSPDWSGRKPPWNWWDFLVNVYNLRTGKYWKITMFIHVSRENHLFLWPCSQLKIKKTLAVDPPNPSVFHNGGLLLARMFVKFSSPYDVFFF